MPTHIHAIIALGHTAEANLVSAGASPRPTLMDVVRVFKSMSTRLANQSDNAQGRKIWQTSFYEHIVRDESDYLRIMDYIENNPAKWREDRYFTKTDNS